MKNKGKLLGSIIGIILFIICISGITYAIYTWKAKYDFIEGSMECFDVNYVKGSDIGSNENSEKLYMGSKYTDGLSTSIKMNVNNECGIKKGLGTLYLVTYEEVDDTLIETGVLSYQILENGVPLKDGNITSKGKVSIYNDFELTTTERNFTIYVWINGEYVNEENVNSIVNARYKGEVVASVKSMEEE